jgi:integrase/recombinase XerD
MQAFFTTYLAGQRGASGHTIAAYSDTWRLLLTYIDQHVGIKPARLDFADVNVDVVTGFLHHLETVRGNKAITRNARLAAIHALFGFAAHQHPEHADVIARILAVQPKNTHTSTITYLNDAEVEALLHAPNRSTQAGRRDHLMLLLLITTGLRVSELTHLTTADIHLGTGAHLSCHGKGRKTRIIPLNPETAKLIRDWINTRQQPPPAPLFTAQGTTHSLSTDAVEARVRTHAITAAESCPSLAKKNVTPHTLRHTTAMRLLAAGTDLATIALWLGHESTESTNPYLHADLALKQQALERTAPPTTKPGRYTPTDPLLTFLESL